MARWSVALPVALAIVGITGTFLAAAYLSRGGSRLSAGRSWLIGLGGLAPAWLVGLLALLESGGRLGPDSPLPPSVLASSSAALVGVIVTDWAVRRLQSRGPSGSPMTCWLLGIVALLPAWALALWVLL